MALDLRDADGGVTLRVRVQPRASRDGLSGERDGALVVRLTAPPVEGRANEALVRFLAEELGVPRRQVRLVSGESSRTKVVSIEGVTADEVAARLQPRTR